MAKAADEETGEASRPLMVDQASLPWISGDFQRCDGCSACVDGYLQDAETCEILMFLRTRRQDDRPRAVDSGTTSNLVTADSLGSQADHLKQAGSTLERTHHAFIVLHPQGPPHQQAQRIGKHRDPHHTTNPPAIAEGNLSGIRDNIQSYQDHLLRSGCGLQVPRTTKMSVQFQDRDQSHTTPTQIAYPGHRRS